MRRASKKEWLNLGSTLALDMILNIYISVADGRPDEDGQDDQEAEGVAPEGPRRVEVLLALALLRAAAEDPYVPVNVPVNKRR